MNHTVFAAVSLMFLLGLIHSILGERLIFRHLRKEGRWIDTGINGLRVRQIRALWSTWHLITLFGWSIAVIVATVSTQASQGNSNYSPVVCEIVAATFGLATPFWFLGTKGKHPAWIVFILIAVLTWFGR